MSNMPYCRFENTSRDLEDCLVAIKNGEVNETSMSSYEFAGKKRLLELCQEICEIAEEGGY